MRPTPIGKVLIFLQGKIILVLIPVILIAISLVFISTNTFSTVKTTFLSPQGTGIPKPTVDPLYEKILKSHTTDHYPPNNLFPVNLTPKFNESLNITADAYAVVDRDSREILYAENLTQRLPIASLTKVMTVLVALENAPLDLTIKVPYTAAKIGEASMGLTSGEKLTLNELLYGAMLPSGNDAAESIAIGVGKYQKGISQEDVDGGGGRELFLAKMNAKAQENGMMDTYFFNPTGLDGESKDKTSFSTALDLLALAHMALQNPKLAEIAQTKYMDFPYKEGYHKAFYLVNILALSDSFGGIKGIKPGSSNFARETLMSYIERGGKRLIVVILGSDHTKDDVLVIYKKIFGVKK